MCEVTIKEKAVQQIQTLMILRERACINYVTVKRIIRNLEAFKDENPFQTHHIALLLTILPISGIDH